ncbi:TetR/AcrR family transcriptional regulator [Nocardia noduli]|uniref:TetR/AcrR family transcriptional regulator n=1 Tax=Nocardia noduli TaxID=2815722 RepID=UPI0027E1FA77|nr:TetR/AcrR family transcriptional regulator [Nocardia noduli]
MAPRGRARERVLEAALALFTERGVSGTSLQMIADRVGVSKASVYYQFQSKDDIALAVIRPAFEDIERVVRIAEVLPTDEARRSVAFSGLIELVVRHRHIAGVFYGDPAVDRLLEDHRNYKEAADRLADLLTGPGAGVMSRVAVSVLVAGIHYSAADPDLSDLDDSQLRVALLECSRRMVGTIGADPEAPSPRVGS